MVCGTRLSKVFHILWPPQRRETKDYRSVDRCCGRFGGVRLVENRLYRLRSEIRRSESRRSESRRSESRRSESRRSESRRSESRRSEIRHYVRRCLGFRTR